MKKARENRRQNKRNRIEARKDRKKSRIQNRRDNKRARIDARIEKVAIRQGGKTDRKALNRESANILAEQGIVRPNAGMAITEGLGTVVDGFGSFMQNGGVGGLMGGGSLGSMFGSLGASTNVNGEENNVQVSFFSRNIVPIGMGLLGVGFLIYKMFSGKKKKR